jgi:hypothetical protein
MKNSKTKNKSIIDVYPTIYNVDIVVANKYTTIKQLNKRYSDVDNQDFTDDSSCIAFTDIGYDKKTGKAVIIIKYNHPCEVKDVDKRLDLVNTCAHEALHVCMKIYSKIGENVYKDDTNELFAYLLGWVTECIYKTLTK